MRIPMSRASAELIEKKSRFIATVAYTESEEEAKLFIMEMKKKYWDAKHNCSAWRVGPQGEFVRFSDDGEPGRTAGKPILDVICSENFVNTTVVVTRYFGGTLLGTGGLVRAYTKVTQDVLSQVPSGRLRKGKRISLQHSYQDEERIRKFLEENSIRVEKCEYLQDICRILILLPEQADLVNRSLSDITSGRMQYREIEGCSFVDLC